MRACPGRDMYVWRNRVGFEVLFCSFGHFFCGSIDCGPAVRSRIGWILFQVTFLKIIFHRFDLPLPVFRGSKGSIRKK
jgi:hypothetical protein